MRSKFSHTGTVGKENKGCRQQKNRPPPADKYIRYGIVLLVHAAMSFFWRGDKKILHVDGSGQAGSDHHKRVFESRKISTGTGF